MIEPKQETQKFGGALWVKVLVVAIFAGGIGWFLWNTLRKTAQDTEVMIIKRKQGATAAKTKSPSGKDSAKPPRHDGIIDRTGSSTIHGGDLVLQVSRSTATTQPTLYLHASLRGASAPILSPDHRFAADSIRALLNYPRIAEEIKLTPEQRSALAALNPSGRTTLTPDEDKQIKSAMSLYYKSDLIGQHLVEEAIVAAVRDMAPAKAAAARQASSDGLQKFLTILTQPQRDQLQQIVPNLQGSPLTRPVKSTPSTQAPNSTRPSTKSAT